MRSTSRIVLQIILAAYGFLALSDVSAHGVVTVKARTPEEIVNAVLAANSSGKTTVIHVAPGDYQFSQSFAAEGSGSALPPVTGTVVLIGRGASTTRFLGVAEGTGARFITVTASGNVLVRGITFTRGFALCQQELEICFQLGGGAFLNSGGVLWIEDCVLSNNGASHFEGGQSMGGAVLSTGGHLHIGGTTITDSRSLFAGGGIAINGGTATLRNSIVSGNNAARGNAFNEANFSGAGLYIIGDARVWIFDSTISGNIMGEIPNADMDRSFGAGIHNASGTVWLVRSAVTENFGGQLGFGGGILNGNRMFITDSTIGANSIGTRGGGIYNSGTLTLRGVTIAHNEEIYGTQGVPGLPSFPDGCDNREAPELCTHGGGGIWNEPTATVYIASSVIASNRARIDGAIPARGPDCAGVLISSGHNALGSDAGCQLQRAANAAPDKANVDPRLGELTDNGKPSELFYPILPDSPLIDAGGKVHRDCGAYDQLGHRRKDGDHDGIPECDIGAVEFQPPRPR